MGMIWYAICDVYLGDHRLLYLIHTHTHTHIYIFVCVCVCGTVIQTDDMYILHH